MKKLGNNMPESESYKECQKECRKNHNNPRDMEVHHPEGIFNQPADNMKVLEFSN